MPSASSPVSARSVADVPLSACGTTRGTPPLRRTTGSDQAHTPAHSAISGAASLCRPYFPLDTVFG